MPENLTITHQQLADVCREHRKMTALRIERRIKQLVRDDATFDCGDNVLARVMQQRIKEILTAVEELQEFAERGN